MHERLERLNMIVLTIVILYTIAVQKILISVTVVNPVFDSFVALLTSVGFYRLLLILIYAVVRNSPTLLKLYWGRMYLQGLWSYKYVKEGDVARAPYFGVWRFEQGLLTTKVIGFGLDENFERRSSVRSVTDLIENRGAYEIVNIRTDSVDPERNYYSRTAMTFDRNKGGLSARHPVKIRAQTMIYGGVLTGDIHRDVFEKHEAAMTEDEVIEEVRKRFEQSKHLQPAAHDEDEERE